MKKLSLTIGTATSILTTSPVLAQTEEVIITSSELGTETADSTMLLFWGIFSLVSFIVWLVLLIKLIKSDANNKGLWIAITIIFGALGAIIAYFAAVRPSRKASSGMSLPATPQPAPAPVAQAQPNFVPQAPQSSPAASPASGEVVMPSPAPATAPEPSQQPAVSEQPPIMPTMPSVQDEPSQSQPPQQPPTINQ